MNRFPFAAWLVLATIAITACQGGPFKRQKQRAISQQPIDTLRTLPAAGSAAPQLFETIFQRGNPVQINKATATSYGIELGSLPLPTGRLIACDPLHIDEYGIAFVQSFPKGEFPVQVAIIKLKQEEYVGFSRIVFSNEPVAKWERALVPGEQAGAVSAEGDYGFSVDNSMAVYMDSTGNDKLVGDSLEGWNRSLVAAMERYYRPYRRYARFQYGRHTAIAFTTGLQDGRYASFIGYDAAGRICRFETDYGLVKW